MLCARSLGLHVLLPVLALGADYDEKRAIEYANLAGAAYCIPENLKTWKCGSKCIPGVTDVHVCHSNHKKLGGASTLSYVGRWDNRCLAVFEGTNGLRSMRVDLEVPKRAFDCEFCDACEGCDIHMGFDDEWLSHEECVIKSLGEIGCTKDEPLYATGHSLGGATVTIGMMKLASAGWNVAQVYTFGAPRVGNYVFAQHFMEKFRGKFYRVVNNSDPMVDMPPVHLTYDAYVQVNPQVFYKRPLGYGTYTICDRGGDPRCSAQYGIHFQWYMDAKKLAYHHTYMGIDVTQGDCKGHRVGCEDAIPSSWCTIGAGCNQEVRGPSHCTGKVIGECRCNWGYCANKFGHCDHVTNIAPGTPTGVCFNLTGGTCRILSCRSSRGPTVCTGRQSTESASYQCKCQPGYCADKDGVCKLQPGVCTRITDGTCKWLNCGASRGPTICNDNYKCECKRGYCVSENGMCVRRGEEGEDSTTLVQEGPHAGSAWVAAGFAMVLAAVTVVVFAGRSALRGARDTTCAEYDLLQG